ncbi:MAG TPA: outer membrane protein transport protein [Burkholderiaceae bacterium]|nr:outer membrane protein transport protein [Burkholderiaceae bacterium]
MNVQIRLRPIAAALLALGLAPGLASATDGYFANGYGVRSNGMAGTSLALAPDAMGGANNPASMAFVGQRLDLGVNWFNPQRSVERFNAAPGLNGSVDSDKTSFWIPEFGVNTMIRPDVALGLTVYGNGGMNTDYPGGQLNCGFGPGTANMLCGSGNLGVDLSQLIIAPTLAWQFSPGQSLGFAPLFGYQRFKAYGLQAFTMLSSSPQNVTNNGYDDSTGWGLRLGYQGVFGAFRVGAVYTTKMSMSNFDKYKGLFAEQGGFDMPENFGVGVAFDPAPAWTLAADWLRINYSGVASVGNSSRNMAPLGFDNGPGFGWRDVNVFRIGAEWRMDPAWTLRAGYNYTQNPVTPENVTFNILAPGVVQNHLSLGFTWNYSSTMALSGQYTYAFDNSVEGPSLFNMLIGPGAGGTERISMHQNILGVAWSMKF